MIPALLNVGGYLLKHWRVVVALLVALVAMYAANRYAENRVAAVRAEYAQAAAKQAIEALHTVKKQERITEDVEAKHRARVSALHTYYTRRLQQRAASAAVPAVPESAITPTQPARESAPAGAVGACDPAVIDGLEFNAVLDALTIIEWQEWYEAQRRLYEEKK